MTITAEVEEGVVYFLGYLHSEPLLYDGELFPIYLNVGRAKNNGENHIYDITNKIRDTADRINGLERPKPNEGYALKNGISNNSIPQNNDLSTQKIKPPRYFGQ